MKETLRRLYEYETLDRSAAYDLLLQITSGQYNEVQVAGFLSAFLMRRPTIEELKGFRQAMMSQSTPLSLRRDGPLLDIVGTGGDGKNTFNISTLSALVLAGAGVKVVKHGNYAASSVSGSSDVLEYLGYEFTASPAVLQRELDKANICFLHAPLFHPAMKKVATVRSSLGVRTFFNLLGPVINPAQPDIAVLGVSHLAYTRMYHYLLQGSGQIYCILHSLDGYDEVSLTSACKVITPFTEQLLSPADLGMSRIHPDALLAGPSVKQAAALFLDVLRGRGTEAQAAVVVANSGLALHSVHPSKTLSDCIKMARESLVSGAAYSAFKQLIS